MNLSNIKLPSNRRFGLFFTTIFWIAAAYSFYVNSTTWLFILGAIGLVLFVLTIINADTLLPFNKLWMKFGLLLGMIVSPIVMAVIFFLIFFPIAILMRLFGRDELRLQFKKQPTHWVSRVYLAKYESFKNQF